MVDGWSGPDPVQQDDGSTNYELGTDYTVAEDVTINAVRVWHGASSASVPGRKGRLWTGAGSLLTDVVMDASLPNGWTSYALAEPLERLAGSLITVSYTTQRFYGAGTGSYPRAAGDLSVSATGGRFSQTLLGTFPVTPTGTFYGIDIQYTVGTGGNQPPVVSVVAHQISPLTVQVDMSVVDEGAVTYRVEWGDGSESLVGGTTRVHTYAVPGTYIVLVTATDVPGLSDSTAVLAVVQGVVSEETIANRRITQAFIDARPSVVKLTPRTRYMLGNGAWKWQNGTPRADQVMRVIEQGPPEVFTTTDGLQRRIDYVLLAPWDAGLAKGDVFPYDGDTIEVIETYHNNGYEIRAACERRLDPPS
jgi:PKD repeat protein